MTGNQLSSAFEWSDTLVAVYLTWHVHAQFVVLLGTLFGQGMEAGRFHVVTPALRLQNSLHYYTGLLHQPHDLASCVPLSFANHQWCGACSPGQAQGGVLCSTKCE